MPTFRRLNRLASFANKKCCKFNSVSHSLPLDSIKCTKHLLCHADESVEKVLEDILLNVDPAGGEADLSLVDEGRPDHGWHTLVQVCVFEHYPCILSSQLYRWDGKEEREKERKGELVTRQWVHKMCAIKKPVVTCTVMIERTLCE